MRNTDKVVIALCKCTNSSQTFGMRAQSTASNQWLITWAFPVRESAAKREGYDKTIIKGAVGFDSNYPGCPHCGNPGFVVCSCGRLSCYSPGQHVFTCKWCGQKGNIEAYRGESITAGVDI